MDLQSGASSGAPGSGRSPVIALVVTVAILLAAVTTAWLLEISAPEDVYSVTVFVDEQAVAEFSAQDLAAMEQVHIVAQGQNQVGPSLLSVLAAAGVDSFEGLVIRGQGLRDDGVIELTRSEVTPDVVLDFAERGTVKICSPKISWADRVRDVQVIEVR